MGPEYSSRLRPLHSGEGVLSTVCVCSLLGWGFLKMKELRGAHPTLDAGIFLLILLPLGCWIHTAYLVWVIGRLSQGPQLPQLRPDVVRLQRFHVALPTFLALFSFAIIEGWLACVLASHPPAP